MTEVVVKDPNGGATFDLVFEGTPSATFISTTEKAADILSQAISNQITIKLDISQQNGSGGLANVSQWGSFSYDDVRAALVNAKAAGSATLPVAGPIEGSDMVWVPSAEEKALGLGGINPNDTSKFDGWAYLGTSSNVVLAEHELTHAMGRLGGLWSPNGGPDIMDLEAFRGGVRHQISQIGQNPGEYFSLDGGVHALRYYGNSGDSSDWSYGQTPEDTFDAFYNVLTPQTLSTVDKEQLSELGFSVNTTTGGTHHQPPPSPPPPSHHHSVISAVTDAPLIHDQYNLGSAADVGPIGHHVASTGVFHVIT